MSNKNIADIDSALIKRDRDHFEVYVNGEFFCTADTYSEAISELAFNGEVQK